jgi:hypothetical protein
MNKILKTLMLVPAALGLVAPSVSAAELNIEDVDNYSTSEQVTSISQFSDVQPTDWAYQALENLVERYGCVAGYPDGTFRGGRAMTRYEAAALLNACLDRVTEVTDELKRLMVEFEKELAVLKGRVDGLETRVGNLEATQFSTTTKLNGEASFILGGVPGYDSRKGVESADGTAFNYDLRLNFDTSFTGEDLLRTRLRSGNFSDRPFGTSKSLFKLDKAETTDGTVEIDRLYYQFPVGEHVTLTAGPLVRNSEMVWRPSAYRSGILDFFAVAGVPGVYNKATGAGVGVEYEKDGFVAAVNYVAENGDDTNTGVFDADGALNVLGQVGYRQDNWGLALGYRYGTTDTRVRTYNGFRGATGTLMPAQDSHSIAVNGYWSPSDSGWVPSVSAGYGYNDVNNPGRLNDATDSHTWYAGLQWDDVLADGNAAGFAIGNPANSKNVKNDSLMLELFYKAQVTDNISITPAVFYVSNDASQRGNSSEWGGVIQTTFKF